MNIFIPNKLPGSGIIKIGAWKLYLENEATAHVGAVRLNDGKGEEEGEKDRQVKLKSEEKVDPYIT